MLIAPPLTMWPGYGSSAVGICCILTEAIKSYYIILLVLYLTFIIIMTAAIWTMTNSKCNIAHNILMT
jgi:hypothetical protein